MKRPFNYYLIVTTSTEMQPPSPFAEFQWPPRKVEARFCIETKSKRITHKLIYKTMLLLECSFNYNFMINNNDMRVKLGDNKYTVYKLPEKPNKDVVMVQSFMGIPYRIY